MLRDRIERIDAEEISIAYHTSTVRNLSVIPKRVLETLGVNVGDKIFYIHLSDGSIKMMNETLVKERLGEYYEQLLPDRIIDED